MFLGAFHLLCSTSDVQKILEELETGRRQYGLRVELYTFHPQLSVTQAHNRAVIGFGRDFQGARQRFALDDQRMIARGDERLRQVVKYGLAIVLDFAGLAMHQLSRANHTAAKRRADGLMAKANTENRNLPREPLDERHTNAGFRGGTRAWRNYDMFGAQFLNFV